MNYCTSCGEPIPDGQGKSCSMCYGDPDHGRDGYYRRFLEEQEQESQRQRYEEEQQSNQEFHAMNTIAEQSAAIAREICAKWRAGAFRKDGGVVNGITPIIHAALSKVHSKELSNLKFQIAELELQRNALLNIT